MRTSIIAAVADNGVIGAGNALPWHLPEDLKRFRGLTMGHHLIVGRKTFEAIGKPLPGRKMLVMTRTEPNLPEGVVAVPSLSTALAVACEGGDVEVFVAGGAEIYRIALPAADSLYLTRVHGEPEGDTSFPSVDWDVWHLISRERHEADERHAYPFTFEQWVRISLDETTPQTRTT